MVRSSAAGGAAEGEVEVVRDHLSGLARLMMEVAEGCMEFVWELGSGALHGQGARVHL
jgi:hypothetical protein